MGITSFLLDTSAYSAFNRGATELRPWFASSFDIKIPLIVIGELRAGFAAGSRSTENEALLRRFLDAPTVSTLPLTLSTTQHFANLFLELRKKGIALSTNDLWIASLALENSLPILTMDTDFSRVPGVEVVSVKK